MISLRIAESMGRADFSRERELPERFFPAVLLLPFLPEDAVLLPEPERLLPCPDAMLTASCFRLMIRNE